MATKDKKALVRLDPALAAGIKSAAALHGLPSYRLLESVITAWLAAHHPSIWDSIRPADLPDNLKDIPGPQIEMHEQ
jgi:hypothetical protein